jgi:hypothetical protein
MVIDSFHIVFRAIFPAENNSPLLVDSNAPEPSEFPVQKRKPIARRNLQILNDATWLIMRNLGRARCWMSPGKPATRKPR